MTFDQNPAESCVRECEAHLTFEDAVPSDLSTREFQSVSKGSLSVWPKYELDFDGQFRSSGISEKFDKNKTFSEFQGTCSNPRPLSTSAG